MTIKIKPLTWEDQSSEFWTRWMATHAGMVFRMITRQNKGVLAEIWFMGDPDREYIERYPSLGAAKAAAQEEWKSFVMSAIES